MGKRRPALGLALAGGRAASSVKNQTMGDLKDSRLMYLKAALFLAAGVISGAGLLMENLSLQRAFLLLVCVWSFCRLYYFLFYVIEKYIDGDFKFAGLGSFLLYMWRRRGLGR